MGSSGVVALHVLQTSSLTTQATQVIKLRATDLGRLHHVNLVDNLRGDGENTLDAMAEADLADGEAGLRPAGLGDDYAFKRLKALFVAFFNLHLHADGVARNEIRNICTLVFC